MLLVCAAILEQVSDRNLFHLCLLTQALRAYVEESSLMFETEAG